MGKRYDDLTEKGKKQSRTKLENKNKMLEIKVKFLFDMISPEQQDRYILRFCRNKI